MMSNSRFSLIALVDKKFQNKVSKASCLVQIKRNLPTRMFDNFPFDLLHSDKLNDLTRQFKGIVLHVHRHKAVKDLLLTDDKDKEDLSRLIREIAQIGFEQLATDTGDVYRRLLTLFEVSEKTHSKRDVLCAYLGAVFGLMVAKMNLSLSGEVDVHTPICHYINKAYAPQVEKLLRQQECKEDVALPSYYSNLDIFKWPKEHPQQSALIISGILAAGVALFSYMSQSGSPDGGSPASRFGSPSPRK